MSIEETIALAVVYAEGHLGLDKDDETYFTNLLLGHFGLTAPYKGPIDPARAEKMEVPDEIVDSIVDFDVKMRLMDLGAAERDATWVMGVLSPRPSQVSRVFAYLKANSSAKATEYLYDLMVKNDYIQKSKVDKNLRWVASYQDGPALEISINLSKPEKDNKDIARLVHAAPSGYPACFLCKENVGFAGSATHPARENIRVVPVTLDGGQWYLQYSPYVYYPRHCIVFYEKHVPMAINPHILRCLFDFVDQFPRFFIGSNSDLPIVGGSILNHEHFQGGGHEMPIMKSKVRAFLPAPGKLTSLAVLDFYDTVLKVYGPSREEIVSIGSQLIAKWRAYDDPKRGILSHDGEGLHSTVTPIVRKVGDTYELYLILRNNRCTKEFPDGLFHAHPEYHYVKKEGIGLIEAAGLFILPSRLLRQGKEAEECVEKKLSFDESLALYPDLKPFAPMLRDMKENGVSVRQHLSGVCQRILRNVGVYKDTPDGQEALRLFVKGALE